MLYSISAGPGGIARNCTEILTAWATGKAGVRRAGPIQSPGSGRQPARQFPGGSHARAVRRTKNGRDCSPSRRLWFGAEPAPVAEERRSAALTRQLRLLRGQGLIHKVPKTPRYPVSAAGQRAITALLAARNASTEELTRYAG